MSNKNHSPTPTVAFIGHTAQLSGGEIALLRVLPHLTDFAELLVVLAEDGPLVEELVASGVNCVVLPLALSSKDVRRNEIGISLGARRLPELAQYICELAQLLKERRVDLVHTNTLKAAIYGGLAARLAGLPVVWHIRDRIAKDYLPWPAVFLVRLLSLFVPNFIIANSNATALTLPAARNGRRARLLGRNKPRLAIIRDSVESRQVRACPPDSDTIRAVMIGRLSPWKGQDLVIRSLALLPRGTVSLRVIGSAMFGEVEYVEELENLIRELDLAPYVRLVGFKKDVWPELERADLAIHYSVVPEPLGQVVLEAMAQGVAVVAANAGGPAEIISHAVNGWLVEPGRPDLLAAALRLLSSDAVLRSRLGSAAIGRVRTYTPERTAAQLRAVYSKMLNRERTLSLIPGEIDR